MLTINIPETELFDERTNEFIYVKAQTLQLEHSLVSISKWEAKWKKPFISKQNKTVEETIDYIRCMTITQNVKPEVYRALTNSMIKEVEDYIGDPMTATTFKDDKKGGNKVITSEVIYYWMTALNIPFECQKWHLNRLLTLIKVASIENSPKKKMSPSEVMRQNKSLNAARRKAHNTRG